LVTRTEAFLFASNVVVFILVPIDIAFLAGFFSLPGDYLFLANLIGVAVTLVAFRVKRRIRMGNEAKAVKPEVGAETSDWRSPSPSSRLPRSLP
jgi:hypothetical protein